LNEASRQRAGRFNQGTEREALHPAADFMTNLP
jgi:hypothetical protein